MMNKIKKEIHLFIIWEKARYKQDLILEDLNNKFSIIDVKEIIWSKFYFSSNLTRFYGENLPEGSHKENHCGNGSFLAIIVEDLGPRYNERLTTKGLEKVNINTFDAKDKYRYWTGGGHKIHATNSIIESAHDIALLFKQDINSISCYKKWDGKIKKYSEDLAGYDGWKNIEEYFRIINYCTNYVVLRNFECLPQEYHMEILIY